MISKIVHKLFKTESEFSKKWMSRVTIAIICIFVTVVPLIVGLLFLHLKFGLSYRMCTMIFSEYISLLKISVSAYFVTFIGYMGKAYLGKKEEMKNKCESTEEKLSELDGINSTLTESTESIESVELEEED